MESKIKTLEEIKKIVEKLRKEKKKIVFTNGCFDILHVGHIRLFKQAKSFGDVLILGLNSDKSVKKIKSGERPIVDESDRAEILENLESIDYIIFFNESTPIELISEIKPDFLVKGKDYEESEVVGKEIVESNGGVVKLIDFVNGKSTSKIIDKIKEL